MTSLCVLEAKEYNSISASKSSITKVTNKVRDVQKDANYGNKLFLQTNYFKYFRLVFYLSQSNYPSGHLGLS